jgi:methionyl-tRNA formyltransferase
MNVPRIAVICGGPSAYKSINILALEGYLCGIAIASEDKDQTTLLGNEAGRMQLPFEKMHTRADLSKLEAWFGKAQPDAVFSIGFPYLVPTELLSKLPGKFINFHHGPLPKYRGAMPIFEVLRAGEKETAVTVHVMEAEFDEGPVVFSEPIPIDEHETFGSLAVKIADRTSLAVQNTAQMLLFGNNLPAMTQNEEEAAYFPVPEPEDTLISWPYMEAKEIVALVNACNPWNNGADTFLRDRPIKLLSVSLNAQQTTSAEPGTILHIAPDQPVRVACINGEVLDIHIIHNEYGVLPSHFLARQHIQQGHLFKQ